MGSPRESEVSIAVEAGAETPVVVQDAKVLPVGHKGRGSPLFDGDGGEPKSPRSRRRPRNAQRQSLRSAVKGSMPGRLIQPLSKRVVQDA